MAWIQWRLVRWLRLQRWLGELGRLGIQRRLVRLVGIEWRLQRWLGRRVVGRRLARPAPQAVEQQLGFQRRLVGWLVGRLQRWLG